MSSSTLPSIPYAPDITGLAFRYVADEADYTGIARVRADSAQYDGIDPRSARESIPTEEDLRGAYGGAQIIGSPDLLLATMHDESIGYNQVLWRWTEVTGVRVYLHLGYLLPRWRGKGIGSAMLRWSRERIRAIAADEQADERATFATNVSSTEREADALIRDAGYDDVRHLTDMLVVLESLVVVRDLPDRVQQRAVEPDHHRAIYGVIKDAYAEIWLSTPESDADFDEFLGDNVRQQSYDPSLWHVAWSDDQAVGVVIGRISDGVGYIAEVHVRRAWQRKGIGRSLLQAALATFAERGITEVRLYTDAADGQGARSLYESLGFREVKQHIFYRKLLRDKT